jgi:PAS domain S-box-containing protein
LLTGKSCPLSQILIVDDSPGDRAMVQFLLKNGEDSPWNILEAATGSDGLEMAGLWRPDCILLDYRLPDMEGTEFLRRLPDKIPVIMLTSGPTGHVAVQAMKLGAIDFLTKDALRRDTLQSAVKAGLLRMRAMRQQDIHRMYARLVEIIATSDDLASATTPLLTALCECFNWELGAWWQLNSNGEFECRLMLPVSASWERYAESLQHAKPARGEGFLYGAASSGRPVWISLDTPDGKCQAVACPVQSDAGVTEVIAGYGRWLDLTNEDHSRALLNAALQIGQFVSRGQALEALRASERELADTFDNAPTGIHWTSAGGVILRLNRRLAEILGYSVEELLGRNIADFHLDRDVAADYLRRLRAGETVLDLEATLRAKDGTHRYVLMNSNARFENGKFIHSRSFTRDFTIRKQAQDKLGRTSEELARSNADLEQFAYVASHDLMEPLRTISSFTTLLTRHLDGKLDSTAAEYFHHLRDAVSRMQSLIDDLLAYSTVRNTTLEPKLRDTAEIFVKSLQNPNPAKVPLSSSPSPSRPRRKTEAAPDTGTSACS